MKSFGFWKEFFPYAENLTSLLDVTKGNTLEEKDLILSYLKQGKFVTGSRGVEPCIFNKNAFIPEEIYTDGVWLWTSYTCYYLEKYDIKIDKSFLDHIRSNNFICPIVEDSRVIKQAFNHAYQFL